MGFGEWVSSPFRAMSSYMDSIAADNTPTIQRMNDVMDFRQAQPNDDFTYESPGPMSTFGAGAMPTSQQGKPFYQFNPGAGVFEQFGGGGADDMNYQSPGGFSPSRGNSGKKGGGGGGSKQKQDGFSYEQKGEQGPPSWAKDDYKPRYGGQQQEQQQPTDPVSQEFDNLQMRLERRLADAEKTRESGRMANELAIFFGTIGGDEKVLQTAYANKERAIGELDQIQSDLLNIGPAKAKALADYQQRMMMEQQRQMEQEQQNQAFYAQIAGDLDWEGQDPRMRADVESGAAAGNQAAIGEALQHYNPQMRENRLMARDEAKDERLMARQERQGMRAEGRAEQAAMRAEQRLQEQERLRGERELANIDRRAQVKLPPPDKNDADWAFKYARATNLWETSAEQRIGELVGQLQRMMSDKKSYHPAAIGMMTDYINRTQAELELR